MDDVEHEPAIRASDAEREHVIDVLREAVVAGRLTLEEFSDRVDSAQIARTDRELAVLAVDLPAEPAPTPGVRSGAYDPVGIPQRDRHLALWSRIERRGYWELPVRSEYRSVFGTIDLDLTQARLAGHQTDIEIYNLFGTVTLIVPEGVEVNVSGGGAFASQVIAHPAPRIANPPRLNIHTRGPGGTLYIRSRQPAATNLLERLLGRHAGS
jgi:hypothetical protein